jgi:heat shock protein HslJ
MVSPMSTFAKAFEEDREVEELCKTFVLARQDDGEVATAQEQLGKEGKELWLERSGGPGKVMEEVVSNGTVVLREVGPDGKGFLRVLI